jgi:hypothetical protein
MNFINREKLDNISFVSNFKIYWGIPTSSCRKFNMDFANLTFTSTNNGLVQNTNDSVR